MSLMDTGTANQRILDLLNGDPVVGWNGSIKFEPRQAPPPQKAPPPAEKGWKAGLRKFLQGLANYDKAPYAPGAPLPGDLDGSPEAEAARQAYDARYRAARALAVQNGALWYNMNDIARAYADQAYQGDIQNAYKIAEERRKRREDERRREALMKLVNDSTMFDDQSRELLSALGPDVAAEVLVNQMTTRNNKMLRDQYGMGNINPGDFTPESIAMYVQSINPATGIGDYSLLRRTWAPPAVSVRDVAGVPTIVDPANRLGGGTTNPLSDLPTEAGAAGTVAGAETAAREAATSRAAAQAALPQVQASADEMETVLREMDNMDVLSLIYGPAALVPVMPGSDRANAVSYYEQLNGQAFMRAYQTLKGGGQITEIEGTKATAAMTRLANRFISPASARKAIQELRDVIRAGLERARKSAQAGPVRTEQAPQPQNQAQPGYGTELGGDVPRWEQFVEPARK